MPVSIKGTGGGSVTLSAAAAATDTTLTIPNVTGTVLQSGTAVTAAQGGTGLTSVGTSGNVLTSNGTAWVSSAPAGSTVPSATAIGQVPFSTDGSTWTSTQKIVAGTAVASTSGTSIDFTSIPSWVKRITVMFDGVSTNGSSPLLLRIGTSGGFATINYTACAFYNGTAGYFNLDTSGFPLTTTSFTSASYTYQGTTILTLIGSNIWTETGSLFLSGANVYTVLSGSKTLSGALTQVRVTTTNSTDAFDAGSINILYE
jgi:hypothetical protein